jgi:hypothetical protein
MIFVKGAQADVALPPRTQCDVAAHDIHDIVGFLDLLDQAGPIYCQGAPVCAEEREGNASATTFPRGLLLGDQLSNT